MEIIITNGHDPRFAEMCRALDRYLNDLVGGEQQRKQYVQYNSPQAVTDVFLLLDDEQTAACAGFKRFNHSTAEVKRVFTKSVYRGHGCARMLMAALEARARAKGYTQLILETGSMMRPAISFYTALGFQRIENYAQYRDMPDSVCFAKQLTVNA